jgi:hypothetical protein
MNKVLIYITELMDEVPEACIEEKMLLNIYIESLRRGFSDPEKLLPIIFIKPASETKELTLYQNVAEITADWNSTMCGRSPQLECWIC